jgi:hypothetical protein
VTARPGGRRPTVSGLGRRGRPRVYRVQGIEIAATCTWAYGIWTKPQDGREWTMVAAPDELSAANAMMHELPTGLDAMLLAAPEYNYMDPTVLAVR